MKLWDSVEKKLLKKPGVKKEFDRLSPQYAVVSQLITARLKKGMTQKEMAEKIGTKQSAIARLEAGNSNMSVEFLEKAARVLGAKLTITVS